MNECNKKDEKTVFDPMRPIAPKIATDLRNIHTGSIIPTKYYADQPYVVETKDGALLCVVTTGEGHEGGRGQHVIVMKSFDCGKTWSDAVRLEEEGAPEASWGVPFVADNGRVFIFYVFNKDDIRELPADNPPYITGLTQRMDSHGYYVFRWSDDHGSSFSKERVEIPVREFEIDRKNFSEGKIRLFWNVGKPFSAEGTLFLPIHKVGGLGEGWFTSSEGGLLRSADLLTVENPAVATWETLPEGDKGIRSPQGGGSVAEEHSFVTLSDGSFFTVFRTIDGAPGCAYSRDQGKTWEPSQYMTFANGKQMKHPRAATFVWKLQDGGYLYCFHNHGGSGLRSKHDVRTYAYNGRNPMWFSRGWEVDSENGKILQWSQPIISFYDKDPLVRVSYPDFIEYRGKQLFTETQKGTARIHELPPVISEFLKSKQSTVLGEGDIVSVWKRENGEDSFSIKDIPPFILRSAEEPYGGISLNNGFSLELIGRFGKTAKREILLQGASSMGDRLSLAYTPEGCLELFLSDGETTVYFCSEPVTLDDDRQIFFIVDGGACILSLFVDGIMQDGGENASRGWSRISPHYRNQFFFEDVRVYESECCRVNEIVLYKKALGCHEMRDVFSSAIA